MPPHTKRIGRLLAWSAGAAFVASLANCAWTYLVRFEHPGPGGGPAAAIADTALFGAFAFHHSLLARPRVKDRIAALVSPALARTIFVWIASALFFVVCSAWRPVAGIVYWHTGDAALAHRALQLLGVAIVGAAVVVIGPLDLAGVSPAERARSPVAARGPYKLVRHPIYLGWVLMVFGSPHMNGTRLSFSLISTAYLLLAMAWEERALVATLGPPYAEYLERVRWRLIPGMY